MAHAARPEGSERTGAIPSELWVLLEARVDQLLQRIRPNQHSEARRVRVADYVRGLVNRCFKLEVQAFMFGSVPLKTYLPDGDIDMAVFQLRGASVRDTWTTRLSAVLEAEARLTRPAFRVKDVQVIHAEVKLLKCLVDNIVVDISFDTLNGLCTLAFLEVVDRHVGRAHLFKRSIILVKAWCYYESRLLGAHHGLISTYALETMVLYIFNLYHAQLHSPLRVLHKFLEVFSVFDWDRFCLSLRGPIALDSFPNPVVEPLALEPGAPPPLLSEDFLANVLANYAPPAPSPPRAFAVKQLNVADPLAPENNLGRSVSKASKARIRKALAHGAATLHAAAAKARTQRARVMERRPRA